MFLIVLKDRTSREAFGFGFATNTNDSERRRAGDRHETDRYMAH